MTWDDARQAGQSQDISRAQLSVHVHHNPNFQVGRRLHPIGKRMLVAHIQQALVYAIYGYRRACVLQSPQSEAEGLTPMKAKRA
ncbi:hypothetical protein [Sodalis sp. RH19]|uniref:hypothetical protein n=1 Tax=Sodalis sp. RH19 TaxID=3394334 RepID=UPI0039B3A92E